jgi:hypothetical protein
MLIGAAIAGLLIVSLFFEMVSSPKPSEERSQCLDAHLDPHLDVSK